MREKQRTIKNLNLHLLLGSNISITDDGWSMPQLSPCYDVPERIIPFNEAMTSKDIEAGVHFFIEDYQFERLWSTPERYLPILKKYSVVFTPDFSIYRDMPLAMKMWNVYRNKLLGAWMQSNGLKVIPTVTWSEYESFPYCFSGLPQNSTLAVSTVGSCITKRSRNVLEHGIRKLLNELSPRTLLIYGENLGIESRDTNIICYDNKILKRLKGYGRKK